MRRILIALGVLAVLVIGWIAVKDSLYGSWLGQSGVSPDLPDYSLEQAWLKRPAEQPPGGWETPWGVDLLVISPPVTTPAPKGLLEAGAETQVIDFERFAEQIGLEGTDLAVYAPGYRSPSPALSKSRWRSSLTTSADDVRAAVSRYLSSNNRERAVIILAGPDTGPLLEAALEALPDDEAFRRRFGGVVLAEDMTGGVWDAKVGNCSEGVESCVVPSSLSTSKPARRLFLPSLSRSRLVFSAEDDFVPMLQDRAASLSTWLDSNAPKPAEPFNSWAADEVVDVVPIRRPNSDQDISGERGN